MYFFVSQTLHFWNLQDLCTMNLALVLSRASSISFIFVRFSPPLSFLWLLCARTSQTGFAFIDHKKFCAVYACCAHRSAASKIPHLLALLHLHFVCLMKDNDGRRRPPHTTPYRPDGGVGGAAVASKKTFHFYFDQNSKNFSFLFRSK